MTKLGIRAFETNFESGPNDQPTILLSQNQLTQDSFISKQVFDGIGNNFTLELKSNRITELTRANFEPLFLNPKLVRVNFHGNALKCGCDAKWVVENKTKFYTKVDDAYCVDGKYLLSKNLKEFEKCP